MPSRLPALLSMAALLGCAATDIAPPPSERAETPGPERCVPAIQTIERWNRSLGFRAETGTVQFQGPVVLDAATVWAFGDDYDTVDGARLGPRALSELPARVVTGPGGIGYWLDEDHRLVASREGDPAPLWRSEAPVEALPVFTEDGVAAVSGHGAVTGFDATTFAPLWRYEATGLVTVVGAASTYVYIREGDMYSGLSGADGRRLWQIPCGAGGLTPAAGETLVFRPAPNLVCKADAETLTQEWCFAPADDAVVLSTAVDREGNVYAVLRWLAHDADSLVAIRGDDGGERWSRLVDRWNGGALRVGVNGKIVYKAPGYGGARAKIETFAPESGARDGSYLLPEGAVIQGFDTGPGGDFYIIERVPGQRAPRLIRLDHRLKTADPPPRRCIPCQQGCLDAETVARCRPDGEGYTDAAPCPADTICRDGACTPCVPTLETGCDGLDFVYMDACNRGYHLIEHCGARPCHPARGCAAPTPCSPGP